METLVADSTVDNTNYIYRRETNDPTLILPVWLAIRSSESDNSNKATSGQLFKCLQKDLKMDVDTIVKILTNMVNDGFVSGVKSKNSEVFFIPDFINDSDNALIQRDIHESQQRDWYCYECHLGGTGLVDCIQCPRVFHLECVRQHIDFPLQPFKEPVPVFIRNTYRQVYGHIYADRLEALEESLKNDLDNGDDENQQQQQQNIDDPVKHCLRCRMMKQQKFKLPLGTSAEELNYLLNLALNTIKTWIANDTFSSQYNRNISTQDLKVLVNILLQNPMTIDNMLKKIGENRYKSLTEFQCDLLDIQHGIGVIRGVNCQEYEAARYLFLNGVNETNEIVNCKQCYRYSNEKIHENWFSLPCQPNHQLVYAKQTGYPLWPAKVVRMVNDELYDVRFFGSNHSRAEISARNIHSIETVPAKSLTKKQTLSLKKSMFELKLHQKLLKKSADLFEFNAFNSKMIESLLMGINDDDDEASGAGGDEGKKSKGRTTNKRKNIVKKQTTTKRKRPQNQSIDYTNEQVEIEEDSAESTISEYFETISSKRTKNSNEIEIINVADQDPIENLVEIIDKSDVDEHFIETKYDVRPVIHKLGVTNTNQLLIMENNDRISPEPPSLSSSFSPEIDNQMDLEPDKFSRELDLLTDLNEVKCLAMSVVTAHIQQKRELMANISKIKKKHWCIICEKEASYYCCWCCTYCSSNCQNYHWKNGHKTMCRNPSFTLNTSNGSKNGRKSSPLK